MNTLLAISRSVHFSAAVVLFASFVFPLAVARPVLRGGSSAPLTRRSAEWAKRLQRLALAALVASLATGLLWLWLEASAMSGRSLLGSLDVLTTVIGQTQFGRWTAMRLGIGAAIAVLWPLYRGDVLRRGFAGVPVSSILALLAGASLGSLAFIGHAAAGTGRLQYLHLASDALHLLAAGVWPGGLLPFALFLGIFSADDETVPAAAAPVARRYSGACAIAASIVLATGMANVWLLVGSVPALFASTYGRLALAKIGLYGAMIGLGGANRLRFLPALSGDASRSGKAISSLRRNVAIELWLALAVMLVVGVMGLVPPALHRH